MKNEIENCTLNRNWIWDEKEYLDIITWNVAIEAAVAEIYASNGPGWLAVNIRRLKK